jgi:pantoate kinase
MTVIFVPTAVSSFFTIEGLDENGNPVVPAQLVGAKGGGFKLALGTYTSVERKMAGGQAEPDDGKDVVFFNGNKLKDSTTHRVIAIVRRMIDIKGSLVVHHRVPLPWGSGFGTSASTALGSSVAILMALHARATLKTAAQIAHEAELMAHTGLGTVGSFYSSAGSGGLITRAGGPGVCELEPFLEDYADYVVVATTLRPRPKGPVFMSRELTYEINRHGVETLERVLKRPTAAELLKESRRFAERTGFMTEEVASICDTMTKYGAIGATQNMIGDAAHCVVSRKKSQGLVKELKDRFPVGITQISEFWEGGVHIIR